MSKKRKEEQHQTVTDDKPPAAPPKTIQLTPLNQKQKQHLAALRANQLVFATGSAGSGKTFIGASWAAIALRDKLVDRVILTRPAIEAGRSLGFLKGTLEEKFEPYIVPVREVMVRYLGRSYFDYLVKVERIQPCPLAYMQGMSFDDAIVLFDEAENSEPREMELLLTRIGERSQVLVSGDMRQQYSQGQSGLDDAIYRLRDLEGVSWIKYELEDVVRSEFCRRVLRAYAEPVTRAGALCA